MTIKVVCQCGATFGAKDELAGRSVACPKCKQPLKIGAAPGQTQAPAPVAPAAPAGGGISDLLDEAGFDNVAGPRCPQCAKAIQPGALLCVNCGFNLQTGERVAAAEIQVQGEGGEKYVANKLLENAADRIKNEKLEDKKTRSQGAPVWVYFVAFVGVLAFVACMLLMPRDDAFRINGVGMIIFGNIIAIIYGIRIIIVAFKESATCGVLYLFVPFYALYYWVTRWANVGNLFMMILLGNAFVLIGWGMIAISPMMAMKEEDDEDAYLHQLEPPAVVVQVDARDFYPQPLPAPRS